MPEKRKLTMDEAELLLNMTHRVLVGTNLPRIIEDHSEADTKRDEGPDVVLNLSLRQARLLHAAYRRMHELVG